MRLDVVELTKELVAIESETQHSNRAVSERIEAVMRQIGFDVERIVYIDFKDDERGVEKVCLVGRLGPDGDAADTGGLGFFGHSDTVPGGDGWSPYAPFEQDGRLVGRGTCDMKGALAAMLVAASRSRIADLRRPLFLRRHLGRGRRVHRGARAAQRLPLAGPGLAYLCRRGRADRIDPGLCAQGRPTHQRHRPRCGRPHQHGSRDFGNAAHRSLHG